MKTKNSESTGSTAKILFISTLLFALALAPEAYGDGTFASTGSLNTARFSHSATLLPNGKVLVAGGLDANTDMLASAELYDTVAGMWTPTGNLNDARSWNSATLLPNGQVLFAGGESGWSPPA